MAQNRDYRRSSDSKAAVALRLAGASYSDIANTLGFPSMSAARVAVELELATHAGDEEGRNKLRAEASARLERLLRSVWTRATDQADPEHLAAVRTATGLVDRLVKLHGLDAPAEIVVHNPTTVEIDQWVNAMLQQQTEQVEVVEADVVEVQEAEIVEVLEA